MHILEVPSDPQKHYQVHYESSLPRPMEVIVLKMYYYVLD